jgi:ArsR family transcriptional regulator
VEKTVEVIRELLKANPQITQRQIMEKTGLSQANVSQHLSIMKSKGIVAYERKGKNVYYRLHNPKIVKAFDIMREALIENLRKRL